MIWRLRWVIAVLFVAGIVIVTGLATALGVAEARSKVREAVVEQQRSAGQATANGLDAFMSRAERSLTAAAAQYKTAALRPPVDPATLAGPIDPLLAFLRDFDQVSLVDSAATPLVVRPQAAAPPAQPSPLDFEAARRTFQPQLSLAPGHGGPHWIVSIPASRALAEPAFLVGYLRRDRIEELLFANVPTTADAMLLDARGDIVASTAPEPSYDPGLHRDHLVPLATGRKLALEDDALAPRMFVTMSPLPNHAASALVMSPAGEVALVEAQLVRSGVFTAVALSVTAGVLGVFVASRISRPLADVRAVTRQVSRGDVVVHVRAQGPRELQDLVHDFNAMSDALGRERARLLDLHARLEDLVRERTAQLEEKRKEMELFFYGVSHDFKSPLIAIAGLSQLADEELARPRANRRELKEYLGRIRRSAHNLQTLIQELLQFARAERVAPTHARVNAAHVLRGVAEEAQPLARERRVRLEAAGPPVTLVTDAERLRHAVANLVQNAVKYMPGGRRGAWVRLDWRREAGDLVVRVRDNGAGIPERVRENLFRPFAAHRTEGPRAQGSGLGLSIARRFTESLGGTITVDTVPDRGTTFEVRVPVRPAEPQQGAA